MGDRKSAEWQAGVKSNKQICEAWCGKKWSRVEKMDEIWFVVSRTNTWWDLKLCHDAWENIGRDFLELIENLFSTKLDNILNQIRPTFWTKLDNILNQFSHKFRQHLVTQLLEQSIPKKRACSLFTSAVCFVLHENNFPCSIINSVCGYEWMNDQSFPLKWKWKHKTIIAIMWLNGGLEAGENDWLSIWDVN